MRKIIALVGSSSTGKSTVFELLKLKLSNYAFLSESTRTVLNYGFNINENGDDATQLAILSYHLRSLLNPGNLVLDRCILDNYAYSMNLDDVQECTRDYIFNTLSIVKNEYTHVVYFPIEFESVNDGVRSVNEEWRREVDSSFKYLLETLYPNQYLTVFGSPKQRTEQILNYLNNGTK